MAKCLAHIERAGVSNIRLFTDDARLVIAGLPERSLARVFVLFPDPWPKTRHHKRRFVQRETLDRPTLDFTLLAKGMGVPGAKAHDLEELTKQLTYAMSQKGPYLIDVVM